MKIKTSELIGVQLDWAVTKCEGLNPRWKRTWLTEKDPSWATSTYMVDELVIVYPDNVQTSPVPRYSTNWAQGGPIIEREHITIACMDDGDRLSWSTEIWPDYSKPCSGRSFGPTPLIAAMRCYVASKLGDEVDIPEELL